jgi:hypothetical protein
MVMLCCRLIELLWGALDASSLLVKDELELDEVVATEAGRGEADG